MLNLETLALECGVIPIEQHELGAKIQESLKCGVISQSQLSAVADALVVVAEVLR